MIRKYLIFACLLLVLLVDLLISEEIINTKYGVYGGLNLNVHSADFYKLAGIPNCCPNFESGSGIGYHGGILLEYKIANDIWIAGRIGIITLDGELIKNESTTIITQSGPTAGLFEHKLSGFFNNIGIEPRMIYYPINRLQITLGTRIAWNLSKKFNQIETIVEPLGSGTFLDSNGNDSHSRTRNNFTGEIPNTNNITFSLIGGIGYELPLNKRGNLILAPEIQYYLPLIEMVKNTNWYISNLTAGIALKFTPLEPLPKNKIFKKEIKIDTIRINKEYITENQYQIGTFIINTIIDETDEDIVTTEFSYRTDTIFLPKPIIEETPIHPEEIVKIEEKSEIKFEEKPIQKEEIVKIEEKSDKEILNKEVIIEKKNYFLDGDITAVGINKEGIEIINPVFKIEEFISNRLDPLLNYIFFDDNSSIIPNRYFKLKENEIKDFNIEKLFRDSTLSIYYNILNVFGQRLTEFPNTKIKIVGCNSNFGLEKDNLEISLKRAQSVKDYFVNIWNINPNRIKVEKRNLPQNPSTPIEEDDKIAENRRVEIQSDFEEILKPIFIEKIDRTSNSESYPSTIKFKLKSNSEAGLNNWELTAYQLSNITDKFIRNGDSVLPESIDWILDDNQKIIPKNSEPIIYNLRLTDKSGKTINIEGKTFKLDVSTIKQMQTEKINNLEIERFNLILFDFDKATLDASNKKIIDFIKKRIKPNSDIEISGYTDRTGSTEYNQKLSQKRLLVTRNALNRPNAKSIDYGKEKLLFNNDLPEGRFYCRTVQIVIKNKLK